MTIVASIGRDISTEEWQVLPEFPDYEVTVFGGIRRIDTKEYVETYMGRVKPDAPLHPRVRLKRHGVIYPNAMRTLIKSAFGEIPRSVIPKQKEKAVFNPLAPSNAPLIDYTALNAKEWRVIPEFPKYRITIDGDLRNRTTGKVLKLVHNEKTNAYFHSLWKLMDDGTNKSFKRSCKSLVLDAFPELRPDPKEKVEKRRYIKREGWVNIPGFPTYQMHRHGAIRWAISRRRMVPKTDGDTDYV
jgi:hypothetical protein